MIQPVFVGIDVSKSWLDVYIHPHKEILRVPNDSAGLEKLIERLQGFSIERVVIESTGKLEYEAVRILREAGLPVTEANPLRIRSFARAKGILAKTDRIDARVIALFGEGVKPDIRPLRDKVIPIP